MNSSKKKKTGAANVVIDEVAARRWCEALARTLRCERITREGEPYLDRYFVAGWSPVRRHAKGVAVFLHHIRRSDPLDQLHSHPWAWALSLILVGGYTEYRCSDDRSGDVVVREYCPGAINVLEPSTHHRIHLPTGRDCWSLFLSGPATHAWGFGSSCRS